MEDPTKIDSSGGGSKGDENKTAIKTTTTGGMTTGDFVAGTVLADRYRIIGLVGKGGMGEVYKAEDLQLSQVVALKFLPEAVVGDEDMLARFRAEVRNARQVSHVNVCRVFDIGEIDGRHFLSMEFVDGDDLSDLLTRVGRFTSERAVEISRQLCVGMEAIHKAGILHRDFKPANIIIDKKGVARITDFGIAGIESEIAKDGIRAGTPAYMAPEQITGKEVSARSDIYALGLVIYEIFTGKQAFIADNVMELIKMHQTATPTNASEIVKGIDPLVESVISQCLEKDPKNRPQSALHVAMALPGGNPLQMALDAGQTPSPDMVAAAPKVGSLRPVVAFSLLAVVILGFVFGIFVSKYVQLYRFVPLEKSREVLQERARELVEKYGYRQVDSYGEFTVDSDYTDYLTKNDSSPDRWQRLSTGQPAILSFWFRTSPEPLVPWDVFRKVSESDPPTNFPGMAFIYLDTKGRLTYFHGVPQRVDGPSAAAGNFDWPAVFKDAGLDVTAFEPVEPQWTPRNPFDERRTFSGKYPDAPDIAIRIEAAAYRGKLVSFEIVEPWTPSPDKTKDLIIGPAQTIAYVIPMAIFFGILFVSCWLAARNIRDRRSDVRGAIRVMLFVLGAHMVYTMFSAHHTGGSFEVTLFVSGLKSGLYQAAFAGLVYLAFEPYMRKSAPERLISWTRLLGGDWQDPLVGRDILIGAAAETVFLVVYRLLLYVVPLWLGQTPAPPTIGALGHGPSGLAGIGSFPGDFLDDLSRGLFFAVLISFLILFVGLILRRKSLGTAVVLIVGTTIVVLDGVGGDDHVSVVLANLLFLGVIVLVPARFGVLATISFWLFLAGPSDIPFGTWYTSYYAAYVLTLLALAVFGFYTSTAGQKLWQGKLLGDGD